VLPPHDVIPIIFVPGVMATNLRFKSQDEKKIGETTWMPPNDIPGGLITAMTGMGQCPATRQIIFNPETTEINPDGPCNIEGSFMLNSEEARRRGWGEIHAASYHKALARLDKTMNEQTTLFGGTEDEGNYLMPELGLLEYLEERNAPQSIPSAPNGEKAKKKKAREKPDYVKAAQKTMQAWGKSPPGLSAGQIERLHGYYYPVWVHGYHWLQSNARSAERLLERIEKVLAFYRKSGYFNCLEKVILVTHSMGGLVARYAAHLLKEKGEEDKILGVVHGVQPFGGAPILYRRFRAGTEANDVTEAAFAAIIGWGAEHITPEMACAATPWELMPNKYYPKGWLKFVNAAERGYGEDALLESLPKVDAFEEIYSKTTDDCWWGTVDPALIDPAGIIAEGPDTPLEVYQKTLIQAKTFQDTLGLFCHSNTYGFYGVDEKKFRAPGSIIWESRYQMLNPPGDLLQRKMLQHDTGGMVEIDMRGVDLRLKGDGADMLARQGRNLFKPAKTLDEPGDGTVAASSGSLLEKAEPPPKFAFRLTDVGHQYAFDNEYAFQATIYSIARIVQSAPPPTPY
jgi:pimeloyl-ACP methyl ester carboxylesterase